MEELKKFVNDIVTEVDNTDKTCFFHIARYSKENPFWTIFVCENNPATCGGHFCIDRAAVLEDVLSVLIETGWKVDIGAEFYFDDI